MVSESYSRAFEAAETYGTPLLFFSHERPQPAVATTARPRLMNLETDPEIEYLRTRGADGDPLRVSSRVCSSARHPSCSGGTVFWRRQKPGDFLALASEAEEAARAG